MVRLFLAFCAFLVVASAIYIGIMLAIAIAIVWGLITAPKETIGFLLVMGLLSFIGNHPLLGLGLVAFLAYLAYKGTGSESAGSSAQLMPVAAAPDNEWHEHLPGVRSRPAMSEGFRSSSIPGRES